MCAEVELELLFDSKSELARLDYRRNRNARSPLFVNFKKIFKI